MMRWNLPKNIVPHTNYIKFNYFSRNFYFISSKPYFFDHVYMCYAYIKFIDVIMFWPTFV